MFSFLKRLMTKTKEEQLLEEKKTVNEKYLKYFEDTPTENFEICCPYCEIASHVKYIRDEVDFINHCKQVHNMDMKIAQMVYHFSYLKYHLGDRFLWEIPQSSY